MVGAIGEDQRVIGGDQRGSELIGEGGGDQSDRSGSEVIGVIRVDRSDRSGSEWIGVVGAIGEDQRVIGVDRS